jgi:prolipoprotein diacylglyceryltransferase
MSPVALHTLVEAAAYAIGFRYFLYERRRLALPALADRERSLVIGVGAIVGAALGAKLAFLLQDPAFAFADFPDWRRLVAGKSIVGGLLGGLAGVEISKRAVGVHASSGDAFVHPLIVGIAIGRVGCFLAGLSDRTYGNPTTLPWGIDFGDGLPRHPTQLYEIAFLFALAAVLHRYRAAWTRPGDRFRAFMIAYLAFRLVIDFIKPMPTAYFGVFSGIQLLCLAGLAYYHRDISRFGRPTAWASR